MGANSTRVLAHIHHLELGGTQLNAVDFAWALRPHGFETILAGPRDTIPASGPSLLDVAEARGVQVIPYDRAKSTPKAARILDQIARDNRIDLVHSYSTATRRSAYWGPCRLGLRPLVSTLYEMSVSPSAAGLGADLIVGTGYLKDEVGEARSHVHLVSPPVDLERDNASAFPDRAFLRSVGLEPGLPTIVLVSRLSRSMKGLAVELALSAADVLANTGLQLLVVGTGDAEADFRSMAEAINARNGRPVAVLAGPLGDPRPAYASADIIIGMGGSAARGLAFAKPLIVSGENGWFAQFTPETSQALFRNSFWSPEASPTALDDLVKIIRTLLETPSSWASLGAFGRTFAEQHFGLSAMAARQAQIYRDALANYGMLRWSFDLGIEARVVAINAGRRAFALGTSGLNLVRPLLGSA